MKSLRKTRFISCEVFKDEIRFLGIPDEDCLYLEQGLHRVPGELNLRLSKAITEMEEADSPDRIVLVYGYCGGGLENIGPKRAEIILVKRHDCIPLLLGGEARSFDADGKGIFYLSPGWIKYGKTPLTEYEELKKKYDPEMALWICNEMIKNYGRVVAIQTMPDPCPMLEEEARKFADFFRLECSQIDGDLSLLKRLLQNQSDEEILSIRPGQKLSMKEFQ